MPKKDNKTDEASVKEEAKEVKPASKMAEEKSVEPEKEEIKEAETKETTTEEAIPEKTVPAPSAETQTLPPQPETPPAATTPAPTPPTEEKPKPIITETPIEDLNKSDGQNPSGIEAQTEKAEEPEKKEEQEPETPKEAPMDQKVSLEDLDKKDTATPSPSQSAGQTPEEKEAPKEEEKVEAPKEEPIPPAPEESNLDKKNKKIFLIGIVLIVIILSATGLLLFLILGGEKEKKTIKVEPVKEEVKKPVEKKLVKEDWTLEVLNGSGVKGLASKKAESLEEAGYTVVKTGNADNQNYEKTELYVSEALEKNANLLIEDLKELYKVTEVKGKLTDSTASARIILGKDQE